MCAFVQYCLEANSIPNKDGCLRKTSVSLSSLIYSVILFPFVVCACRLSQVLNMDYIYN